MTLCLDTAAFGLGGASYDTEIVANDTLFLRGSSLPEWTAGDAVAVRLITGASCTQQAGTAAKVTLNANNATPVLGRTATVTATSDYTLSPPTISIAAGATTGTSTFTAADDAEVENYWRSIAGERVVLQAKNTSPQLTSNPLVFTIQDNDGPFAGRRPAAPTLSAVTSVQNAPTATTLSFNVGCLRGSVMD